MFSGLTNQMSSWMGRQPQDEEVPPPENTNQSSAVAPAEAEPQPAQYTEQPVAEGLEDGDKKQRLVGNVSFFIAICYREKSSYQASSWKPNTHRGIAVRPCLFLPFALAQ